MADHAPLTPAQRRQAIAWVAEKDPAVGDALATELELDPTVRLLLRGVESIRDQAATDARDTRAEVLAELRATRWQLIGVVVLAMVIQAGMVGLSISLQGVGPLPSIEVAPKILPDTTDANDDAAFGPWQDTPDTAAPGRWQTRPLR